MQLTRAAQWANIAAVVPATYCAYGTWVLLHAGAKSQVPAGQFAPPEAIRMVNLTGVLISLGVFLACVIVGSVLAAIARKQTRKRRLEPTLTIHSAVYGTDPVNDMNVTSILQGCSGNTLVLPVENDTFGRDPAQNQVKRLTVEYSYGNQTVIKTSRPEHSRLVLPEDSWLRRRSEQLDAVLQERQQAFERINTLATETNAANAKVREQEHELLDVRSKLSAAESELGSYRKEKAEAERAAELLKNAPNFVVRYVNGRSAWEKLVLTHANGSMAVEIRVGDVVSVNTHKVTTIPSAVPLVGGGQEGECRFMVEDAITRTGKSLPDVLRGGGEHTPVAVSVSYQDPQGNHYEREFALTREADDSVRWTPGPIKLRDLQAARSA